MKSPMRSYLQMILSFALILQPLATAGAGGVRDQLEAIASTCCSGDSCCSGGQIGVGATASSCCSHAGFEASSRVCCVPTHSDDQKHASSDESDECPCQENSCPCCVPTVTLSAILSNELTSLSAMTGSVTLLAEVFAGRTEEPDSPPPKSVVVA